MNLKSLKLTFAKGERERDAERDAETEIARNLWKNYKLLKPGMPGLNRWEWVLVLLITFTSWQIPFVLVFNLPDDFRVGMRILDYFIDAFFWMDIIVGFFTSFYQDEQLITDRKVIARHQLTSWVFYSDLIANIPWDVLGGSATRARAIGCSRPADDITVGNLRVLRLVRLLRLRRVVIKMGQLKGGVALRFMQLLSIWFLLAHWTACGWWFIGKAEYQLAEWRECNGVPASNFTPWLVRIPPTGLPPAFSTDLFHGCVETCILTCANNCTRISCMANNTCDNNNLNPDLSVDFPDQVWNQWLTSCYWALTMLMKMPNVGPDTTLEKAYSCFIVILGAIFFVLLLGQVTTLIMVMAKSGAQLRDQLVTMTTWATSRRLPAKMTATLKKHLSAEWSVTKGMDTQMLLADFPTQLRGAVLEHVFAPLLDCNPPFLRCSEQLRRALLALLKPSVALQKQTILAGNQFGATMYILMKGTLQVAQAPPPEDPSQRNKKQGTRDRRGVSVGKGEMKRQLTAMNTKSHKDKLKVRMLEKPGACIPMEQIFEGPKTSPFSVFAVKQSQLLTLEAPELARLLDTYPAVDASVVTQAFETEYRNLATSLKMGQPTSPGGDSSRQSASDAGDSKRSQPEEAPVTLADKIAKMEAHANILAVSVVEMQMKTASMPAIWKALEARLANAPAAAESAGGNGVGVGDELGLVGGMPAPEESPIETSL